MCVEAHFYHTVHLYLLGCFLLMVKTFTSTLESKNPFELSLTFCPPKPGDSAHWLQRIFLAYLNTTGMEKDESNTSCNYIHRYAFIFLSCPILLILHDKDLSLKTVFYTDVTVFTLYFDSRIHFPHYWSVHASRRIFVMICLRYHQCEYLKCNRKESWNTRLPSFIAANFLSSKLWKVHQKENWCAHNRSLSFLNWEIFLWYPVGAYVCSPYSVIWTPLAVFFSLVLVN